MFGGKSGCYLQRCKFIVPRNRAYIIREAVGLLPVAAAAASAAAAAASVSRWQRLSASSIHSDVVFTASLSRWNCVTTVPWNQLIPLNGRLSNVCRARPPRDGWPRLTTSIHANPPQSTVHTCAIRVIRHSTKFKWILNERIPRIERIDLTSDALIRWL